MYSLTNGYLRNKEKDITSSLVTVVRIVSKRNITGPEMPVCQSGVGYQNNKCQNANLPNNRVERSKPTNPNAIAKQPNRKKKSATGIKTK
jgi:hypothetical protein